MPSNAEVVERLNVAFQAGDTEGMLACMDPEVELLPMRAQLEGKEYRGHEGFLQMVTDLTTDWEGLSVTYTDLREKDDRLVLSARLAGRGRASGVDMEVPLAFLFDFRDGVAVRIESFLDTGEALRAAGIED